METGRRRGGDDDIAVGLKLVMFAGEGTIFLDKAIRPGVKALCEQAVSMGVTVGLYIDREYVDVRWLEEQTGVTFCEVLTRVQCFGGGGDSSVGSSIRHRFADYAEIVVFDSRPSRVPVEDVHRVAVVSRWKGDSEDTSLTDLPSLEKIFFLLSHVHTLWMEGRYEVNQQSQAPASPSGTSYVGEK